MLVGTHTFKRDTRGIYYSSSPVLSVLASAQAAAAGLWWLINPAGSGVTAILRRLTREHSCIAAAAANTRITVERMTFTGTSSGGSIGAIQRLSTDPAPICIPLSATTGLTPATVNSNAVCYTSWSPPVITAAGVLVSVEDTWWPLNEDSLPIILPGEGFVVRQPDNGVTTDPRKLVVSAEWEEYS